MNQTKVIQKGIVFLSPNKETVIHLEGEMNYELERLLLKFKLKMEKEPTDSSIKIKAASFKKGSSKLKTIQLKGDKEYVCTLNGKEKQVVNHIKLKSVSKLITMNYIIESNNN